MVKKPFDNVTDDDEEQSVNELNEALRESQESMRYKAKRGGYAIPEPGKL